MVPLWYARSGALLLGLIVLLCGAVHSDSAAKDYIVDAWRFDDDLPRDGIISIAQAPDGYLWLSSRYGLARFDGVRYGPRLPGATVEGTSPATLRALASNSVASAVGTSMTGISSGTPCPR